MNYSLFLDITVVWCMHGMGFNGSRTWTRFDKRSRMAKVITSHRLVYDYGTCTTIGPSMAVVFVGVVAFRFSEMRPWSMMEIRWNMVLEEVMVRHGLQ